jgi:hypothetical protein
MSCAELLAALSEQQLELVPRGVAPQEMHQQRDDKHSQEYKEQDLGNARCGEGDTSKTQEACDQCDDQENQSVVEHDCLLALANSSACVSSAQDENRPKALNRAIGRKL